MRFSLLAAWRRFGHGNWLVDCHLRTTGLLGHLAAGGVWGMETNGNWLVDSLVDVVVGA